MGLTTGRLCRKQPLYRHQSMAAPDLEDQTRASDAVEEEDAFTWLEPPSADLGSRLSSRRSYSTSTPFELLAARKWEPGRAEFIRQLLGFEADVQGGHNVQQHERVVATSSSVPALTLHPQHRGNSKGILGSISHETSSHMHQQNMTSTEGAQQNSSVGKLSSKGGSSCSSAGQQTSTSNKPRCQSLDVTLQQHSNHIGGIQRATQGTYPSLAEPYEPVKCFLIDEVVVMQPHMAAPQEQQQQLISNIHAQHDSTSLPYMLLGCSPLAGRSSRPPHEQSPSHSGCQLQHDEKSKPSPDCYLKAPHAHLGSHSKHDAPTQAPGLIARPAGKTGSLDSLRDQATLALGSLALPRALQCGLVQPNAAQCSSVQSLAAQPDMRAGYCRMSWGDLGQGQQSAVQRPMARPPMMCHHSSVTLAPTASRLNSRLRSCETYRDLGQRRYARQSSLQPPSLVEHRLAEVAIEVSPAGGLYTLPSTETANHEANCVVDASLETWNSGWSMPETETPFQSVRTRASVPGRPLGYSQRAVDCAAPCAMLDHLSSASSPGGEWAERSLSSSMMHMMMNSGSMTPVSVHLDEGSHSLDECADLYLSRSIPMPSEPLLKTQRLAWASAAGAGERATTASRGRGPQLSLLGPVGTPGQSQPTQQAAVTMQAGYFPGRRSLVVRTKEYEEDRLSLQGLLDRVRAEGRGRVEGHKAQGSSHQVKRTLNHSSPVHPPLAVSSVPASHPAPAACHLEHTTCPPPIASANTTHITCAALCPDYMLDHSSSSGLEVLPTPFRISGMVSIPGQTEASHPRVPGSDMPAPTASQIKSTLLFPTSRSPIATSPRPTELPSPPSASTSLPLSSPTLTASFRPREPAERGEGHQTRMIGTVPSAPALQTEADLQDGDTLQIHGARGSVPLARSASALSRPDTNNHSQMVESKGQRNSAPQGGTSVRPHASFRVQALSIPHSAALKDHVHDAGLRALDTANERQT